MKGIHAPRTHTENKRHGTPIIVNFGNTIQHLLQFWKQKSGGIFTLQLATKLKRSPPIPMLDLLYMPFYDHCNLIVPKRPTIFSICLISYQS